MTTFADVALPLAAAGYPVFPLKSNKKPWTVNGFHDASRDPAQIAEWGERWGNAMVGVPTGKASGLFVLDVDTHGDKDGFATLAAKGWELPATRAHETRSGGRHYLFRYPDGVDLGNSAGRIGEGLDTRGDGGYIVWWATHGGEVVNPDVIADVPPVLLEALFRPASKPPAVRDVPTDGAIGEGARNDTLFRLAASLRGRGLSVAAIEAALIVENAEKCAPPLPDADVRRIAASTGRYQEGAISDLGAEFAALAISHLAGCVIPLTGPEGGEVGPPPHVVDKWLPEGEVTLLAGHGGGGKSYVSLSLAVHVCMGLPFGGLPTKRAPVLFYSAEDGARILQFRLSRICHALGIAPADLAGRLHLVDASDTDPALHREQRVTVEGRSVIVTEMPMLGELAALVRQVGAGLVIIDNASDTYDDDEIKRARVRRFIRSIRARIAAPKGAHRCAVLLLAHVNKMIARSKQASTSNQASSEDYSGSTAWHNSVRSRLSITPTGESTMEIDHQKANLGEKAQPVRFIWTQGVPMVEGADAANAAATARNDADKAAILALVRDFDARGVGLSTAATGTANTFLTLKDRPGFPPGMGKDAFRKVMMWLEADGTVIRVMKKQDSKPREYFTCAR